MVTWALHYCRPQLSRIYNCVSSHSSLLTTDLASCTSVRVNRNDKADPSQVLRSGGHLISTPQTSPYQIDSVYHLSIIMGLKYQTLNVTVELVDQLWTCRHRVKEIRVLNTHLFEEKLEGFFRLVLLTSSCL